MSYGAVLTEHDDTLRKLSVHVSRSRWRVAKHIMPGGFDAWLTSSVGGLDSVINGTALAGAIKARVSPGVTDRAPSDRHAAHPLWKGELA